MTLQFYATICSPRPGCKHFKRKLYAINHLIVASALRSDYADENFIGNSQMILSFGWILIIPQLRDASDLSHNACENWGFSICTLDKLSFLFPGFKHFQVSNIFAYDKAVGDCWRQPINFEIRRVFVDGIGDVCENQRIVASQSVGGSQPVESRQCWCLSSVRIVVPDLKK